MAAFTSKKITTDGHSIARFGLTATKKLTNSLTFMERKKIARDPKHDHYWICDGALFESYLTLRGMRYRWILDVEDMPDSDNCSDEIIAQIEEKYLSSKIISPDQL